MPRFHTAIAIKALLLLSLSLFPLSDNYSDASLSGNEPYKSVATCAKSDLVK